MHEASTKADPPERILTPFWIIPGDTSELLRYFQDSVCTLATGPDYPEPCERLYYLYCAGSLIMIGASGKSSAPGIETTRYAVP